jgi:ADP-L-glycero-D-manno-heptose 6-epimerase
VIIVTGGAGFIGSAIVWQLNQRGRTDIVIVDSLATSEKWKNLVPLKFADYIEKDDFMELVLTDQLHNFFDLDEDGLDAIIHMGACSSTTELDSRYLIHNNFEYTKNLALLALRYDARFIYASSAATYGDGACGFMDDETALDMLRPLNMYGYSKHMFDQWALGNGILDKIVGLKFFNVFGPNEYHKGDMSSLVIKAYRQILATGRIDLFKSYRAEYADGEQMRDFVYVKDVVDMALHFLDKPTINGLYNIGSSGANTWNTLATAIFSALDMAVNIEYVEMPESLKDKYQYYTCSDVKNCTQPVIVAAKLLWQKACAIMWLIISCPTSI